MAKKKKEQVKYNPSYSNVTRTKKVFRCLTGKTNIVISIIYIAMALIMLAACVFGAIFDTNDFLEDKSTIATFCCTSGFMAFMLFTLNSCIPNDPSAASKARGNLDGCATITETMMHLPIRKVDAYKLSFRSFMISSLFVFFSSVFPNVMIIIDDRFEVVKGTLGIWGTTAAVFILVSYLLSFYVIRGLSEKARGIILSAALVIYYIVWIGLMLDFADKFIDIDMFGFLSGYVGIALSLICIIAIVVIQKAVVEKRAEKTAWYQK